MKLIVGLGNPGKAYLDSRHNMGFSVVKALARTYKAPFKKDSAGPALTAKTNLGSQNVVLAMPLTFMNLSGVAVGALLKKYRLNLEDLLVVCDDLDLEFGRLKLRPSGSSAGHRGLQSIIDTLGTKNFARLRIGIGRPYRHIETSEYVLSGFSKKEKCLLKEIIGRTVACCRLWVTEEISKSMNIFNQLKEQRE